MHVTIHHYIDMFRKISKSGKQEPHRKFEIRNLEPPAFALPVLCLKLKQSDAPHKPQLIGITLKHNTQDHFNRIYFEI